MHYVTSDLHGCFEEFKTLLNLIDFKEEDHLYIVGDALDRGPLPITLIEYIMAHKNIHLLMGNHELLFLDNVKLYKTKKEICASWNYNGGDTTMAEFLKRDLPQQEKIISFIQSLKNCVELEVSKEKYLLVHAGFDTENCRDYEDVSEHDLLWYRGPFLNKPYKDFTMIMGHIPTPSLAIELQRSSIFKRYDQRYYHQDLLKEAMIDAKDAKVVKLNHKIYLDCGLVFGYRLACIRLEDQKIFYVEKSKK